MCVDWIFFLMSKIQLIYPQFVMSLSRRKNTNDDFDSEGFVVDDILYGGDVRQAEMLESYSFENGRRRTKRPLTIAERHAGVVGIAKA